MFKSLTIEDLQKIRINILSHMECKSITNLTITLNDNLLLLQGTANSFVSKQKAQVVAMQMLNEMFAEKTFSPIFANEIKVEYGSQS